MADISFDVAEGFYLNPFTARMILSGNVKNLQYSVNGAPPSISKYVAYDNLVPPNPFIAVTQDGNGNVVYDGGFPKFYNSNAPTAGIKDSVSVEFNATCDGYSPTGNCFYYNRFSDAVVTIAAGDKLVYDMITNSSKIRCGIDATTNAAPATAYYSMRDWGIGVLNPYGLFDQNGIGSHPAVDVGPRALNQWYHREFDLTKCAGHTFRNWSMAYEGEEAGVFSVRFRDIYIIDSAGRIKATLFKDKLSVPGNTSTEVGSSGYSNLSKLTYDPRAQLTASFKYLYNAILWAANEKKFTAGNRKILIMGDTIASANYSVKGTGSGAFFTSFTRLCATVGFTPTFVDVADYPGGKLDTPLALMEQHACVLLMSAGSGLSELITNACVDALVQYRQDGSGIIIITDDGPVFTDISQAYPAPKVSRQFFATANHLAVRFGTYFTGNYDRTPVNVGFLRANYGDHPLYAGMTDAENISAGGSESRVMVQQFTTYLPGQIQPFAIPLGKTVIQAAVRRLDESVISFKITYNVGPFDIGLSHGASTAKNGEILDVRVSNRAAMAAAFLTESDAVVTANVLKNGTKVGALTYSKATGVVQTWLTGKTTPVTVQNGDVYTVAVLTPIAHNVVVTVKRFQPAIKGLKDLSVVMKALRVYDPAKTDIDVVEQLITEISALVPALQIKHQQNIPINLKLLGEFFANEGPQSVVP
jgi:hypothetical protein